jgi:transposase
MQTQKTRKTRTGRPTKLTPEVQERIVTALRAGNYRETASRHAGISYMTFRRWEMKGEAVKSRKFCEFCEAIKKAEADAEVRDLELISKAAEEQWQAAAWKLERKYPQRWGRRDATKLELSGEVKQVTISDRELDQLREAVKKIAGPDKIVQEKVVEAMARRRRDVSQN